MFQLKRNEQDHYGVLQLINSAGIGVGTELALVSCIPEFGPVLDQPNETCTGWSIAYLLTDQGKLHAKNVVTAQDEFVMLGELAPKTYVFVVRADQVDALKPKIRDAYIQYLWLCKEYCERQANSISMAIDYIKANNK